MSSRYPDHKDHCKQSSNCGSHSKAGRGPEEPWLRPPPLRLRFLAFLPDLVFAFLYRPVFPVLTAGIRYDFPVKYRQGILLPFASTYTDHIFV